MGNLIGQSLGRYHILEQLGEGGMATVYKAYDTRLETDVAVKVIRTENILPSVLERSLKRFEREARSLARLTHPNIVKVMDYGEFQGKPYLVMPHLPGGTLRNRIRKGRIPWQEAIRLLLPIARALEHAHQRGVIHRDVKPSNILITAGGDPMLADFGIAKVLLADEETADLTGTGMGIGTPEYMSPEQFLGRGVTALTDVYSLGVVLYETITGRKPYEGDTPAAIIWKQASGEFPSPKSLAPDLPKTVDKMLLKALARKSTDRFPNMAAFANSLEELVPRKPPVEERALVHTKEAKRIAGGQKRAAPTSPEPISPPQRRRSIPWWIGAGIVFSLAIVAASLWLTGNRTFQSSPTMILESPVVFTKTATSEWRPTLVLSVTPSPTNEPTTLPTLTPSITPIALSMPKTIKWENEEIPLPGKPINIGDAPRLTNFFRIQLGDLRQGFLEGNNISWSPDGKKLAYGFGNIVYIRDVENGDEASQSKSLQNVVTCVSYSANGGLLAAGTEKSIIVWNTLDGSLKLELDGGCSTDISFSNDGNMLATEIPQIWQTSDGMIVYSFDEPGGGVYHAFSPDGRYLAAATTNNNVLIWQTADGALIKTLEGGDFDFATVAFSPNGAFLAAKDEGGKIWLWSLSDWSLARSFQEGAFDRYMQPKILNFSPSGDLLVSNGGSWNRGRIYIWQPGTGTLLKEIELSEGIWGMAFSPNGTVLVIGTMSHTYIPNGPSQGSYYPSFMNFYGIPR